MIKEEEVKKFIEEEQNSLRKVKAEVIRIEKNYILEKEGEEGIKRVLERVKELGGELDLEKLNSLTWEEEWKSSVLVAVSADVFKWTEEDIFQMGRYSPRASFFIKSIIQYLISLEVVFNNMGKYWNKHHNFGSLEGKEINEKEKYLILHKKNFLTLPEMCIYHAGYFQGIAEFVIKGKNIKTKETKCMHKGDSYHEYIISWE